MIGIALALAGLLGASAPGPDYIVGRDAAAKLDAEAAMAAFIKLAEGAASAAQKSDALEEAAYRAQSLGRHEQAMELARRIPLGAISKATQIRILGARAQWATIIERFRDEDIDAWWPDYLNGEAFFCRGRALAATGDGERAVRDLRKAAEIIAYDDNSRGLAWIALGNAYRDLMKDDVRALQAYRATYATSNLAKRCEAAMGAAQVLVRQDKLDDALVELHLIDLESLDHASWRGRLLAARAGVLEKQGKKEEAADHYRQALRLTGLHPSQKAAWEKALQGLEISGKRD